MVMQHAAHYMLHYQLLHLSYVFAFSVSSWWYSLYGSQLSFTSASSHNGDAGAKLVCGHCERLLHPLCLHPPALSQETMLQSAWECPSCGESNMVRNSAPALISVFAVIYAKHSLHRPFMTPFTPFIRAAALSTGTVRQQDHCWSTFIDDGVAVNSVFCCCVVHAKCYCSCPHV